MTTKSQRINLRTTERQEALLRRAASLAEVSLSEFILETAVERAEHLLADRTWFLVSDEQYDEFVELLDKAEPSEKLAKLLASPSIFAKDVGAQ